MFPAFGGQSTEDAVGVESRGKAISPFRIPSVLLCNNISQSLHLFSSEARILSLDSLPSQGIPGLPDTNLDPLKTHLDDPFNVRLYRSLFPTLMTSILPFPPETRPCLKPSLCWNLILWNCPFSFHFSTHLRFQQAFTKCYYVLGNL